MPIATISPTELSNLCRLQEPVELIDVRTPAEFREVHLAAARNVPLDQLDPVEFGRARNGNSGKPLYLICQSGGRSTRACEKLIAAGVTNVVNVEGGTSACVKAGLPVVRGAQTMSIERQVRIAAGSLVLMGAVGSLFYQPLVYLSMLIGAGLVFAGISNTCGMGMLLARMPWNR